MAEQATDVREVPGNVAYTHAILRQLLEYYLARMPLPGTREMPLTVAQFHFLCQQVLAEGYGS